MSVQRKRLSAPATKRNKLLNVNISMGSLKTNNNQIEKKKSFLRAKEMFYEKCLSRGNVIIIMNASRIYFVNQIPSI